LTLAPGTSCNSFVVLPSPFKHDSSSTDLREIRVADFKISCSLLIFNILTFQSSTRCFSISQSSHHNLPPPAPPPSWLHCEGGHLVFSALTVTQLVVRRLGIPTVVPGTRAKERENQADCIIQTHIPCAYDVTQISVSVTIVGDEKE